MKEENLEFKAIKIDNVKKLHKGHKIFKNFSNRQASLKYYKSYP
jgi:hypothetical protein